MVPPFSFATGFCSGPWTRAFFLGFHQPQRTQTFGIEGKKFAGRYFESIGNTNQHARTRLENPMLQVAQITLAYPAAAGKGILADAARLAQGQQQFAKGAGRGFFAHGRHYIVPACALLPADYFRFFEKNIQ